jgi:hypothetical protein
MKKAYPVLFASAALGLAIYSMQTDKVDPANLPHAQLDTQAALYPNNKTGGMPDGLTQRASSNADQATAPFATGGELPAVANQGAMANAPTGTSAPDKEVMSEQEAARRKKMTQLGYDIPPDYYTKNLDTLKKLAHKGDAWAMVHLGEKYYFELNGQKNNLEYDTKANYPALAKESFTQALAAGNIRSAGILSELYLQERNMVDAYAWHLLSKRLDDNISAEWFQKTQAYNRLTEIQKQQALSKVPDLIANLNDISSKLGTKSLF